ncbi:MAG: hypothetical protein JNJ85_04800 [Candidatus Kapabacteria bacterium]|nr:hypothetical protein [Candidatus Kapabacteria bacterium]
MVPLIHLLVECQLCIDLISGFVLVRKEFIVCKQFVLISILFILSLLYIDGSYCATSISASQIGQETYIVQSIYSNALKHKIIIVLKNDTTYYPVIVSDTNVCDSTIYKKVHVGDTLIDNLNILEIAKPRITEVNFNFLSSQVTNPKSQSKGPKSYPYFADTTYIFDFDESSGTVDGTFYTSSRFCGVYFIVR